MVDYAARRKGPFVGVWVWVCVDLCTRRVAVSRVALPGALGRDGEAKPGPLEPLKHTVQQHNIYKYTHRSSGT